MFTDMAGFTLLTQKDEALAMELLEEQRGVVRPILSKYNGREVKTIGDAFLVEFPSSLDAVKCAVEIQSSLKKANEGLPLERRVFLRIGIHLGDVIHTGTDVAGDAVNVASRLEPLAAPGGICVSAQVHDSVANKAGCTFETLGVQELKNVARPMEVFRVSGYGQPAATPAPGKMSAATNLRDKPQQVRIVPLTEFMRKPANRAADPASPLRIPCRCCINPKE
jgi:adenylate cyclase